MAVDWHVTHQDPHKLYGQGGYVRDVVDVHFVIDTEPALGHEDTITIDANNYSADYVAGMIDDKVARVKAVAAL